MVKVSNTACIAILNINFLSGSFSMLSVYLFAKSRDQTLKICFSILQCCILHATLLCSSM